MALPLRIAPEAEQDLVDIWVYVARDSEANADRHLARLHETASMLAENPLAGRRRDALCRDLRSFSGGRYVLFCRVADIHLEVVRVLSGYRDVDALF